MKHKEKMIHMTLLVPEEIKKTTILFANKKYEGNVSMVAREALRHFFNTRKREDANRDGEHTTLA